MTKKSSDLKFSPQVRTQCCPKSAPEVAPDLPIPFVFGSNGEIDPIRDSKVGHARTLFDAVVIDRARRLGISRRDFIASGRGAAAALVVMNAVYGCTDGSPKARAGLVDAAAPDAGWPDVAHLDGSYALDAEATLDAGMACDALTGDELIIDVQTHHVNPEGQWRTSNPGWQAFLSSLPQGGCGEAAAADCFSRRHYLREMFLNSDTDVAVLSAVPAAIGANPLEIAEAMETLRVAEELADSERLLLHGLVLPNEVGQLDGMDRLVSEHRIAAWKVYTPYGGWRLDDPAIGLPFIEKAVATGVKRICAHKGLVLPGFDRAASDPSDIGVVAAAYPDVQFVVYHSGWDSGYTEGPFRGPRGGVDRLIQSMHDNNVAPNSNVWAELGTTWRALMTRPSEAAHVLGKLLTHVGEDRVVWGTDSIWYGSPQDQIMAFRAFQISESLQSQYGYPALTADIKAKVFGLNAAELYGVDPDETRCAIDEDELTRLTMSWPFETPSFRQYGPRTRRELFAFLASRDGRPG